jgi:cation:H+ antiporter
MFVSILLCVIGLIALYYGAEWLVKGAARLATSFGVSPLAIGLTLVAFATSVPELLVSITAAIGGSSDLALGNVVGSNIANIGLILGLTGLVFPIAIHSQVLRREFPLMLVFSLLAYLLALNGTIGMMEGLLLFGSLILFNVASYFVAEKAEEEGDEAAAEYQEYEALEDLIDEPARIRRRMEVARVVVGVFVLMIGARWLVTGATTIARGVGISELVIGMTLVAFGTSLPELATSMVSAFRRESDISVGNIIGSNIYNLLAVLGITSLVRPIIVAPATLRFELPVMLGFSLLLWPLIRDSQLQRWEGGLLLVGYLGFTAFLFVR